MSFFLSSREIALLRAEAERDDAVLATDRLRTKLEVAIAGGAGAVAAFVGVIVVICGSVVVGQLTGAMGFALFALFPGSLAWLTVTNQLYFRFTRARFCRLIANAHATPILAASAHDSPIAIPTQPSP